MMPSVNLCLVIHNHQPIGNFEHVFEQAYRDSYLPFLDVFEPFPQLAISLHTSGPLLLWLAERHPEYLDRLRLLVDAGRVEILGGPQYEPILTMLPRRDRIGQIRSYSRLLERTLGVRPAGMWMPERVWESNLASDLAAAGIAYTVLDDYHFRSAGLAESALTGCFLTEDDGAVVRVFPGCERLRYTIPFAPVQETIDHCWQFAGQHPGSVLTFGDDGEKFGMWPDTHGSVFREGWLRTFFEALSENVNWLKTVTLSEAARRTSPVGKIYIPDCSYREMSRWSLPAEGREAIDQAELAIRELPRADRVRPLLRGGYWRNFRVKYAEANEMYAYMMYVSRRLQAAEVAGGDVAELAAARDHLYRGQCNCAYWHGTFGGIYLPHLRTAVFRDLILADTALDRCNSPGASTQPAADVSVTADDYDFDLMQEVRLANEQMTLWADPGRGGRIYQWDLRSAGHNLLATMQRRPEPYHPRADGADWDDEELPETDSPAASADCNMQPIGYDRYPRKSMMDHFFDADISLEEIIRGEAMERGDFVDLPFEAKIRRAADRVQLQMRRDGNAWGLPLTITKAVTLYAGSDEVRITYLLEHLPRDRSLHFAVEMNFAGLPGGADDRYFTDPRGNRLGHLGERIDFSAAAGLELHDRYLGVSVSMGSDRPGGLWAFPVKTLCRGEGGLEWVQQSVCVMPHWQVRGDAEGRWAVHLTVRTSCEPANDCRAFPTAYAATAG